MGWRAPTDTRSTAGEQSRIDLLRRAAVGGNPEGGCEFAAPHRNFLSAVGGRRRRCRLWRQGAIEAHLFGRQRTHFFVRPDLTLTERSVGGPMFSPAEGAQPMAAVAVRMLRRREDQVASIQSASQRRNTIGDYFNAGTSARAACLRGAKSCSGSQRHGSDTRGRSR